MLLAGLGVPNVSMNTCRKVVTKVGPLYREGGFYVEDANGHNRLCQLKQVTNPWNSGYFAKICNFAQKYKKKSIMWDPRYPSPPMMPFVKDIHLCLYL